MTHVGVMPALSEGARIGAWTLSTQLGTGSSGVVRLAVNDDGRLAAIKIIDKTKLSMNHLQRFRSEVEAMKALEHRHVIELYEAIETIDTLAIVMQFAKNGDLLQYITKRKKLPEDEVRRIFRQICSGVEAAHKAGWIHRDLKVENIYIDENNSVRIGDWGFAGRWSPGVVRSKLSFQFSPFSNTFRCSSRMHHSARCTTRLLRSFKALSMLVPRSTSGRSELYCMRSQQEHCHLVAQTRCALFALL